AKTRLIVEAPAESSCSHSGIFTCGPARLTTAITSGARARRLRSKLIWSGVASGRSARNAETIASPAVARASPSNRMNRQGGGLPVGGPWRGNFQERLVLGGGGAGSRQFDWLNRTAGLKQF